MKRPSTAATPSVVLRAFAEDTEYVLDLDGAILLEALDCSFIAGGTPGLRDTLLACLVMTDAAAVRAAHRTGTLDKLLSQASAGKRLADIMGRAEKIAAALEASIAPTDSGCDPTEKKLSAAPAGGSA
jgi:hypothetical protein